MPGSDSADDQDLGEILKLLNPTPLTVASVSSDSDKGIFYGQDDRRGGG